MTIVSTTTRDICGRQVIVVKSEVQDYNFSFNPKINVLTIWRDNHNTNRSCASFDEAIELVKSL